MQELLSDVVFVGETEGVETELPVGVMVFDAVGVLVLVGVAVGVGEGVRESDSVWVNVLV